MKAMEKKQKKSRKLLIQVISNYNGLRGVCPEH